MARAIGRIPRSKRRFFSMDKVIGSIASIDLKYNIHFYFAGNEKVGKALTKKLLLKALKYHG